MQTLMKQELLWWWWWAEEQGIIERIRRTGRPAARGLRPGDGVRCVSSVSWRTFRSTKRASAGCNSPVRAVTISEHAICPASDHSGAPRSQNRIRNGS
jgi:hypothetical protein